MPTFLEQFGGLVRVFPKPFLGDDLLDFGQTLFLVGEVKDTPLTGLTCFRIR
jgi:hypothetical protein